MKKTILPRLQLFELMDFPWFPSWLRRYDEELRFEKHIFCWSQPVYVRAIDVKLVGIRTMFGSYHHFSPRQAREILLDAKRSGQPIAIYEMTPRSVICLFLIFLNSLFGTFMFTPFFRPFSWHRLFFTYLIPLVPLTLLFDGIVSVFRIYSEEEMLDLAEDK